MKKIEWNCLEFLVAILWWLVVVSFHKASAEICTDSVCNYDFVIRRHKTMTYTTNNSNGKPVTYDVVSTGNILKIASNSFRTAQDPNIGQIVSPDDVITADGYSPRYVITINDQFLGPTIEVMQGSQVNSFILVSSKEPL